jgi:hypothetical protein
VGGVHGFSPVSLLNFGEGELSDSALMCAYCIQRFRWEKLRFQVRQPEVLAEAVDGDRLNAAVFAVGFGVIDRAVDKVRSGLPAHITRKTIRCGKSPIQCTSLLIEFDIEVYK